MNQSDDARASYPRFNMIDAERRQLFGHEPRCVVFLKVKFRIFMQIAAPLGYFYLQILKSSNAFAL
ncbi:hypothetical protein MPL3356_450002 [Mesorhizobium plurifarium]|uniref:Uncharacterized protein n=1 Tax=Mesorhizobium plurifarium TaxID=69974 RepID=A0A090E5J3_MESPL|nr:hypothetical protein MPL3356_450002 [Mesorhizobium plurifarium]